VCFSERAGPAATLGQQLLDLTALVFEYHHDYQDGKLSKEKYLDWMTPMRDQFEATLERAIAADIERLSGSCADVVEHKQALWTFMERDDVSPTNNHAERELRAFVLWRRRSFGTQSDRGNVFAARVIVLPLAERDGPTPVLRTRAGADRCRNEPVASTRVSRRLHC
jgi:transposase